MSDHNYYYTLGKIDLDFRWGDLYQAARPHLAHTFPTEFSANEYLVTVPHHLRKHMRAIKTFTMESPL